MFTAPDVAKVAVLLYGVETLSLASQGETQRLTPEAFVPGAVRLLSESAKVQAKGVEKYLDDADKEKRAAEEASEETVAE